MTHDMFRWIGFSLRWFIMLLNHLLVTHSNFSPHAILLTKSLLFCQFRSYSFYLWFMVDIFIKILKPHFDSMSFYILNHRCVFSMNINQWHVKFETHIHEDPCWFRRMIKFPFNVFWFVWTLSYSFICK